MIKFKQLILRECSISSAKASIKMLSLHWLGSRVLQSKTLNRPQKLSVT